MLSIFKKIGAALCELALCTSMAGAAALLMPAAALGAGDGAELFNKKGCVACHGPEGNAPINPAFPKLGGQNKQYLIQQIGDIKSGARDNGQTAQMKGIAQNVSEDEIEAIADYLSSL